MARTDIYGKQFPVYETCRMCAATQTLTPARRKVPKMYRAGDGSVQCSDAIACLSRRHDLIEKMQAGLNMVWRALDLLAIREGWPL